MYTTTVFSAFGLSGLSTLTVAYPSELNVTHVLV